VDGTGAEDQAARRDHTRQAYDRLAPVWSSTTDDGPFNGWLERPALRSLVPMPLTGTRVLDAGCGSGAQCEWLSAQGAEVVGVDLSPAMVAEARRRCRQRGTFLVADLGEPLALGPRSIDGITCSLVLHYLRDWTGGHALLRHRAPPRRVDGRLAPPPLRPTATR
jgi:ubiquinone/menaquinone biosynthesis C-methylase UbiE